MLRLDPTNAFITTGVVNERRKWNETTKRFEAQLTDEQGRKLYELEILVPTERFGRVTTTVQPLLLATNSPIPPLYSGQQVYLANPSIAPSVGKGGALFLNLRADGIRTSATKEAQHD